MENVIRDRWLSFDEPTIVNGRATAAREALSGTRGARQEADAALVLGAFLLGLIASHLGPVLWTLSTV